MYLLKYELKKVLRNNYFIGSFVLMLLSPIFTLILISLNPRGFEVGDFNQMNLVFLSLIGSKVIFPLTGMLLLKVEYDQKGWSSLFVTPIERKRMLWLKLVASFIWSILLILSSAVFAYITEIILFDDYRVLRMIDDTLLSYMMLVLYILPYNILGFLLAYTMKQTVLPLVVLSSTIFVGYLIQLFHRALFLPSAIPEFIITGQTGSQILPAYLILYITAILAYITLRYLFKNRDY